jgi:hypothetical protein
MKWDKTIAKPPFSEKGWVSGRFLEKPPTYGNNFALKVSGGLRVIDPRLEVRDSGAAAAQPSFTGTVLSFPLSQRTFTAVNKCFV